MQINQDNPNHVEISAEYNRLRSVAPSWTPTQVRESVIDSFSMKWSMPKDEVAEIVGGYLASATIRTAPAISQRVVKPQQILEDLASANPVAKAELERMRSELRQAYADRAQARGTNESVSGLIRKIDLESEALISVLDHSGSLGGENTQRAAYKLRLAVVQATGDEARVTAARESLSELDAPLDDDDSLVSTVEQTRQGNRT